MIVELPLQKTEAQEVLVLAVALEKNGLERMDREQFAGFIGRMFQRHAEELVKQYPNSPMIAEVE